MPDTLFFDFSTRVTKKVPVRLLYQLAFRKNYGVSGPIVVTPDSVIVTGAATDVAGITFWITDTLRLQNLASSINMKLGFLSSPKNNIDIFPQKVKVEVPVDRFTEKVVDVPLKVINNRGADVKLLPERVKLTLLTALRNFSKVERDSITAVVNLDGWFNHRYSQLPVHLTTFPAHSKLVKIEPQTVDFLIYPND